MISKQDFINKIKTDVFPTLFLTENRRKRTLWKGSISLFLAVLIFFFSYSILVESRDKNKILYDLIVSIILCCISYTSWIWNNFISKQKDFFTPIFLKFLGNLRYHQCTIDEKFLHHTCLFSKFNSFTYDDCISGSFKNTEFSVVETELCYSAGKTYTTRFHGICIIIPMKIPVSGYTLLFNTKIPQNFPILKKITLENTTFKKYYQVFSDNQIDARVLLTPAFMEKLNALKKCFRNKRTDISFFGNHAVFAIHTDQDLFESYSLFRSVTNIKTYEKFYDEIKSIYDMIEVLNINNASLPAGRIFSPKLYKQISSVRKKRVEYFQIIILAIFGFIFLLLLFWFIYDKV